MKKNILLVCMLFISQSTFSGPLDWAKHKISSAWFTYKTWNIPRPAMIEHNVLESNGKKFEEFRYNLSGNNYLVGQLRKKLHLFGDYVSDESDMKMYKKYVRNRPNRIDLAYLDASFHADYDNSINACMFRLLNDWMSRVRFIMSKEEVEPFIQLLWEIEDCLPKSFDEDQTGASFLIFMFNAVEKGLPELKEEIPGMFPEISAAGEAKVKNYLFVWQYYSLRFRNSDGLNKAVMSLSRF